VPCALPSVAAGTNIPLDTAPVPVPFASAPLQSAVPSTFEDVVTLVGHDERGAVDACTRLNSKFTILVLFSGPCNTEFGIDMFVKAFGHSVIMVDLAIADTCHMDLSADQTWEHWLSRIREFNFILMEPVCSTFSPARRHKLSSCDTGPRQLRSPGEPYGLKAPDPPFTSVELTDIKRGNLFAKRCFLFARAAHAAGIGSAIESPDIMFDDQASIFQFKEADTLMTLGAFDIILDQCMFGASSTKPTRFRVLLPEQSKGATAWALLAKRCNHPVSWHPIFSSTGVFFPPRWTLSAHPRLTGKDGSNSFSTKSAQVYPPALNEALAVAMVASATTPVQCNFASAGSKVRRVAPVEVTLSLCPLGRKSLMQRSRNEEENENHIGGMRSPVISVAKLPSALVAGAKVWDVLSNCVTSWKLPVISSVDDIHEAMFSQSQIQEARDSLQLVIHTDGQWQQSHSPVRGDILYATATLLGDPDAIIATWFKKGAGTPMGIEETLPATGIFPPVPDDRSRVDVAQLPSHDWHNYASAEAEPGIVQDIIKNMRSEGWIHEFTSMDEVLTFLQTERVYLSKIALISKIRDDGSWKHRLIWDLLRSQVNSLATQGERIILPRIIDLVNDSLDLMANKNDTDELHYFIIDIANAFHLLPLMEKEQKYFCTYTFGKYQVYTVMLFGPKAAPSAWGRFAALIGRLTQAIIGPTRGRLQVYVDDPVTAVIGTLQSRSQTIYVILLWWCVLNIPLAWTKAQYGACVQYIGAEVSITTKSVNARLTKQKIDKALQMLEALMAKPLGSKRHLASMAGLLGFFAGVVPTLWPFIRPLWATLHDRAPSSAPEGMFHTSRILSAAAWCQAFMSDPCRLLTRKYSLVTPPLSSASWLRVSVDASPWGMGGVKWDAKWHPIEFFHAPISEDDIALLGVVVGDSAFMPVLEALAILIALRLWASKLEVAYAVRSDALGAIQALANLRSPNPGVNRVAAELALDTIQNQYAPLRLTHIDGVANLLPDYLSRLTQPGSSDQRPRELYLARQIDAPNRTIDWWRTLKCEQEFKAAAKVK